MPRDRDRHLYQLSRIARDTVSRYRVSSDLWLEPLPFNATVAHVNWLESEGRAGFEQSASCAKRSEKEGKHSEYIKRMVAKQADAIQRVLNRYL